MSLKEAYYSEALHSNTLALAGGEIEEILMRGCGLVSKVSFLQHRKQPPIINSANSPPAGSFLYYLRILSEMIQPVESMRNF